MKSYGSYKFVEEETKQSLFPREARGRSIHFAQQTTGVTQVLNPLLSAFWGPYGPMHIILPGPIKISINTIKIS